MIRDVSDPEHVTTDFVGEPGERTFYIQVADESGTLTVLVEKQQVAAIADALASLLAEVGSAPPDVWDVDAMRLRPPIEPDWRGGEMSVGIDPQLGRFVLEIHELATESERGDRETLRIWLDELTAARLAAHAAWAVAQGRPTCQLCGNPLDSAGHVCPRMNGDSSRR